MSIPRMSSPSLSARASTSSTASSTFASTLSAFFTDSDKPATFWRTLQTFNATRIVVALVLLVYMSTHGQKNTWSVEAFSYLQACSAYLALAIVFTLLAAYHRRHYKLQIVVQIVVDIATISLLYVGAGGAKSGLGMLYLFPLAGGAILASLPWALFFVSVTTLVLLGESVYQILQETSDAPTLQAGLSGAALFFAVFVINRLANKLMRQEALAEQTGKALKVQLAINRMAIADMGDGLLVVGRGGVILMANPVAERLLALTIPDENLPHHALPKLRDFPALLPITEALSIWNRRGLRITTSPEAALFVTLQHGEEREVSVHLKVRFVAVNTRELDDALYGYRSVIFLQDVSEIENQAQQLKLAAMGRLTASVAHEVRNPLAAISYAAALLREEANVDALDLASSSATTARLLKIIDDNVARLDRMVEDILKLSRKAQRQTAPILLAPLVLDIVEEFQKMHTINEGMVQALMLPGDQYR
ncbi:MAG: hypothetical protein NWQ13_05045, partial [Glaciimonas sp.]|nr:hypothetical protein [Glaciimonas sp.]